MRPLSSPGSLHTTLRAAVSSILRLASRAPLGVLAALLAFAVLLGPASATAQPHGTVVPMDTAAHSAGMRYLEAGVAAASAQRFAEAAASFEQAFALLGDIEISYNVGAMRERAGDLPGALRAYERFLAAAPPASVAPGLRAHVEDLRATVTVTVPVPVPQAHAGTPFVEVLPTEPPTQ
jgi:tetratricopeptide (TPR) repeat protein